MDRGAFDTIARLLGGAATRRAGITAAVSAAFGLGGRAGEAAGPGSAQRPKPEGPCGDRTRKDNVCTKDSQCCTGYCKKGIRNKDGKGRCRCAPKNEPCTKKTVCCGKLTCIDGTCRKGDACDVCPQGCAYSTVEEAWAATPDGGTIAIDTGTYPTHIIVDKSMTVKACNDAQDVVLSYIPVSGNLAVFVDDDLSDHTLTLLGVTIDGEGGDSYGGVLGYSHLVTNADNCIFRNGYGGVTVYTDTPGPSTVTNCAFFNHTGYALEIRGDVITVTGCAFTTTIPGAGGISATQADSVVISDCTFSMAGTAINGSASGPITISGITAEGGGFIVNSPNGLITGCTITGSTLGHGAGLWVTAGAFTLENTTISGCTAVDYGAGILAQAVFENVTITLGQGVIVTGNSAPQASGIGAVSQGPTATIVGADLTKVYGNLVGDQCETSTDEITWTPVPTCTF